MSVGWHRLHAQMGLSPPSIGIMAVLSVIAMGGPSSYFVGGDGEQPARGLLA